MEMPVEQPQPEQQAQSSEAEILERFVLNAAKLAKGTNNTEMLSLAQSAGGGPQSIARATLFIIESVRMGLEKKNVEIPGQLWLAENGIISQVIRLITALLLEAGIKIQPEDTDAATEMISAQLANDFDQGMQPEQGGMQPEQGGMQPEQGGMQPEQQPGILAGANQGGM